MSESLKYEVELEDHMSPAAKSASASVAGLTGKLKESKGALSSYQAQLGLARSLGDIEGYRKYGELVDGAKRSVFDLTQQVEAVGKAGPSSLGMLSDITGGLASSFATLATVAAGAVAAIGGAAYATLRFASAATESRARATSLFESLGDGSEGAGRKTFAMLDRLSETLPESRAELTGWARQLEGLGFTDLSQLKGQVQAVASAQALAEGGAEKYLALQRKVQIAAEFHRGVQLPTKGQGSIAELGITPELLAKQYDGGRLSAKQLGEALKRGTADATKFGEALERAILIKGKGPLAELHGELSTVLNKAGDDFSKLFDAIDFAPLSQAASSFFSIIKGGTATGDALKKGMTSSINAIVVDLAHFAIDLEIDVLKVGIWAKHNKAAFKEFGSEVEDVAVKVEKTVGFVIKLGEGVLGVAKALHLLHDTKDNTPEDFTAGGELAKKRGVGFFDVAGQQQALRDAHDQRLGIDPHAARELSSGPPKQAPANDVGGLVAKPAPGEYFASVAPGERIIPARQSRQIGGDALGGVAAAMMAPQPGAQSGGKVFQISGLQVHVHAAAGVTDATALSLTGLSTGLERMQLASGR